jgi:hypothetical protein
MADSVLGDDAHAEIRVMMDSQLATIIEMHEEQGRAQRAATARLADSVAQLNDNMTAMHRTMADEVQPPASSLPGPPPRSVRFSLPAVDAATSSLPARTLPTRETPMRNMPLETAARNMPITYPDRTAETVSDLSVPSQPVVPIKDVLAAIDTFYGHANRHSLVLDDEFFVPFQRWFTAAVWKLQTAAVKPTHFVPLLCQKLGGPAVTSLMEKQAIEQFDILSMSLESFRAKLSSMFADAEAKFTRLAIEMRFRPASLAQDLNTFRTYLMYSSLTSSLNTEFIFGLIRDKLNAAVPNCLLIAQSEFQLSLKPSDGFHAYLDTAVTLAQRLQQRKRTREGDGVSPENGDKKVTEKYPSKKLSGPGSRSTQPGVAPKKVFEAPYNPTPAEDSEMTTLLSRSDSSGWDKAAYVLFGRLATPDQIIERFKRCEICGFFQKPDSTDHKMYCQGVAKRGRVSKVRDLLMRGHDPNAEYRNT